jgi:uncharacterized membrane protein
VPFDAGKTMGLFSDNLADPGDLDDLSWAEQRYVNYDKRTKQVNSAVAVLRVIGGPAAALPIVAMIPIVFGGTALFGVSVGLLAVPFFLVASAILCDLFWVPALALNLLLDISSITLEIGE